MSIMTFKKGEAKTKLAGKKGGKTTQNLHPEVISNLEHGRNAKSFQMLNRNHEHQVNAGKRSRYWENLKAKELSKYYDEMFLPSMICDRICLKEGKLIFVEIKRKDNGELKAIQIKLSKTQKHFQDICKKLGLEYKVVYI